MVRLASAIILRRVHLLGVFVSFIPFLLGGAVGKLATATILRRNKRLGFVFIFELWLFPAAIRLLLNVTICRKKMFYMLKTYFRN